MRRPLLLISIALLLTSLPAPSGAGFTGRNGKIAFASFRQVYAANPDGSGHRRLTSHSGPNKGPAWSPSGKLIAYSCKRKTSYEICLMDPRGEFKARLTNNRFYDGSPSWSSDGTKLVFESNLADLEGIYTMNVDGTEAEPVVLGAIWNDPVWSPDGEWIAMDGVGTDFSDVYKVRPDGSDLTNLTSSGDIGEESPDWSPDGSRIAFSAYTEDGAEGWSVFTMNPDGADVTRVTEGPHATRPAWSPNGSRICFSGWPVVKEGGLLEGFRTIMTIGSDGSGLRILFSNNMRGYYSCDWQPR